jgi:hypothetical protein
MRHGGEIVSPDHAVTACATRSGVRINAENRSLCELHRAVIVAMIAVRVMQASVDEIVDMIAVGNGFMAAAWAVSMS